MKVYDFEHALKETGLYAQAATETRYSTRASPLVLGLPMTQSRAALYDHVVAAGEMWAVRVIDRVGKISPFTPALLCTVCAAVRHLCGNPISMDKPLTNPVPFLSMDSYKPLGIGMTRNFCNEGQTQVHKVFDMWDFVFSPNTELMKRCGFEEVEEIILSQDERFMKIEYNYREGNHTPNH